MCTVVVLILAVLILAVLILVFEQGGLFCVVRVWVIVTVRSEVWEGDILVVVFNVVAVVVVGCRGCGFGAWGCGGWSRGALISLLNREVDVLAPRYEGGCQVPISFW